MTKGVLLFYKNHGAEFPTWALAMRIVGSWTPCDALGPRGIARVRRVASPHVVDRDLPGFGNFTTGRVPFFAAAWMLATAPMGSWSSSSSSSRSASPARSGEAGEGARGIALRKTCDAHCDSNCFR